MQAQLTVNRLDLIKAIEARAALNQQKYDNALAEFNNSDLDKTIQKAIDASVAEGEKQFGSGSNYTRNGSYTRATAEQTKKNLLAQIGAANKPQAPVLFAKELTLLKLAKDETITLDSNDPLLVAAAG